LIRRIVSLLFLLSWAAWAQGSQVTLSGLVVTGTTQNTPGQGEPLGQVEIEVLGTPFVTTSNANGYFAFWDLPDGEYTLVSRKEGFPLARTQVRVRYAGLASHCQILMNTASVMPHTPDGQSVIPAGAVYVAYSKKFDGVLRREASPYELLAQKIIAAGGKLPGLKPEYVGVPSSLNNPVCTGENYLMVYPPTNPTRATFLELPGEPHWLAFDRKGTYLYVAAGEVPMLQIYNAASDHALVRNLPVNGRITDLSLSRDGAHLLVGVMGPENGIMVIDTRSNLPLGFYPTPAAPWAVLALGPRIFACSGDARWGEVVALELASGRLLGRCKVGHQPTGLAATPDGSTLAVSCAGNACVSLVDSLNISETGRVGVGVNPKKLAISPDGSTCAVSNFGSDSVSLIDLKARAVKAQIPVGKQPLGISYDQAGKKLYVACNQGGFLQVLDGRQGTVLHSTVPMPHAVPWGVCIRP